MAPSFVSFSAFALTLLSLPRSVFSAVDPTPCPGLYNNPYTDSNNLTYIVFCNNDGNTGAANTVTGINSFAACMALCDGGSYPSCVSVSWSNGACYLKNDYTGVKTAANVHTAVLCSAGGAPPYPAPVANYVNASSGCGTALPSGLTAGGGSVSFNFLSPDGRTRNYLINVPSTYDVNKAAPLILTFHGKGESGSAMEMESGYSLAKWNPYGISIYPNGVNVCFANPLHGIYPCLHTLRAHGLEIPISCPLTL